VAEETKYAELTVQELGDELEKRGLKKSGKKDELIARLEDDDTAQGGTAPEDEAPAEPSGKDKEKKPARRRSAETAPTPAPKAAPRSADGDVMVRARARYVRSAPRKARLVMEHIRGRPVEQARAHAAGGSGRHPQAARLGRGQCGIQFRARSRRAPGPEGVRRRGTHDQALSPAGARPSDADQQAHESHDHRTDNED
jgi:hypothetical protein